MTLMDKYTGWSSDAITLAEKACARHGGWERFERLQRVSANVVTLAGLIPAFMGMNGRYPAFGRVHIEPHERRARFEDWPTQGDEAVFTRGDVRITGIRSAIESPHHRRLLPRLRWSPVDAAYFFGYALTNYVALPFLLAQTRLVSVKARCLVVDFPEGLDTHSRRQAFHFDDSGLLIAHDYVADVISGLATGRHYSSNYEEVSGMWFPHSRRVVARLGSFATPLPVLHAQIERFTVGSS